MPDVSIVMPVYNERSTVIGAIDDVLDAQYPVERIELIIVDDGSTDGTTNLLQEAPRDQRVRLVAHESNRGKGAAIQTGLECARGRYTAIMDADREYDPNDLARLLEPLLAGEAEIVYGARGFEAHSAFSFWYVVGNKGVTLVANMLFNSWLADIMTCHKVMRTELWRSLELTARGFTIEPEITGRLLARGYRIYEVPVRYQARSRQAGKKLTAADGVRVLGMLIRCRIGRSTSRDR